MSTSFNSFGKIESCFKVPSIPPSFHSTPSLGGAINKIYNLRASAPCVAKYSSGSTILPLDFDIFAPPKFIMPWENKLWKGSSIVIRPRSRRALTKNREYNKCRIACSTPPIYWSTGNHSLIKLELKGSFSFLGSKNLM